jgi:hypothetical protein
VKREVSLV